MVTFRSLTLKDSLAITGRNHMLQTQTCSELCPHLQYGLPNWDRNSPHTYFITWEI